ncbi:MAG TPA: flagellar motor switch protein FliG [Tepidisphaeraceae bacterium]|jgi:flagellar motor switch protein FliG|nr:flagellar motor switch protein FliG [Tepidisphaeraceae bacterium]
MTIGTSASNEISGVRKAAILLLSLPQDEAAEILRRLPPDAVEEVMREIAGLGEITLSLRGKIFNEFYNIALANNYLSEGGLEYAKLLLRKALPAGDADKAILQVTQQVQTTPFSFLQKAESENLLTFIQDEHPQTIALILAHLPPQKASEILVGLPSQKQIEVVKRVANMEQTNPEVIKEVERGLEYRLSDIVSQTFEKAGGVDTVAEILNLADRSTEKGIMEGLEAEDPDLVEQIRRLMFVFEDILLVNDKGIQSVLKEVDNEELSLALKTASQELKDKIFKNMSERAAQLIQEDMQYMGPVRVSDVESAQQKIVDIVRRLEDAGEIIIAGRGGEKEMVV